MRCIPALLIIAVLAYHLVGFINTVFANVSEVLQ